MSETRPIDVLSRARVLRKDAREQARQSGDTFNLFRALGPLRAERLHSDFIAHLLDPRGSHSQGLTFFNLFLNVLERSNMASPYRKSNIDVSERRVQVRREYAIDENNRLDILVEHPDFSLVVENKVEDSPKREQLRRYASKLCERNPGKRGIVVLVAPDPFQLCLETIADELDGNQDIQFIGLPYVGCNQEGAPSVDSWIQECLDSAMYKERIRNALVQYSEALQRKFGGEVMKKEVSALAREFNDPEGIAAAAAIEKALPHARAQLALQSFVILREAIVGSLDGRSLTEDPKLDQKRSFEWLRSAYDKEKKVDTGGTPVIGVRVGRDTTKRLIVGVNFLGGNSSYSVFLKVFQEKADKPECFAKSHNSSVYTLRQYFGSRLREDPPRAVLTVDCQLDFEYFTDEAGEIVNGGPEGEIAARVAADFGELVRVLDEAN